MKTQRETPEWLAQKMADYALNEHTISLKSVRVLEPSAGIGTLVDKLQRNMLSGLDITCVELNDDKCEVLKSKKYHTIHADFLLVDFGEQKFDVIIAAPPFKNNIDVVHISMMYDMLEKDGMIITLTSPYWTVNNETHQREFRELLKRVPHTMEMLPDNTFTEKGRTVPTAILTIYRRDYTNNETGVI